MDLIALYWSRTVLSNYAWSQWVTYVSVLLDWSHRGTLQLKLLLQSLKIIANVPVGCHDIHWNSYVHCINFSLNAWGWIIIILSLAFPFWIINLWHIEPDLHLHNRSLSNQMTGFSSLWTSKSKFNFGMSRRRLGGRFLARGVKVFATHNFSFSRDFSLVWATK